jgi:RHS repeat-associated protein
MTNSAKAEVWTATWTPWGTAHEVSGTAIQNLRFPGQYFLMASGLYYNWHRLYDPTLGRYTQPDPLGFPDGPARYAYAINSPLMYVDPDGLTHWTLHRPQTPIPVPGGGRWYYDGGQSYPLAPQWWHDMINGLVNMCKRAVGFGGGNDDDGEDCKKVAAQCRATCSDQLDEIWENRDLQSMRFHRCVNQCLHDQNCGGTDYSDGWDNGKWGTPRPWNN